MSFGTLCTKDSTVIELNKHIILKNGYIGVWKATLYQIIKTIW